MHRVRHNTFQTGLKKPGHPQLLIPVTILPHPVPTYYYHVLTHHLELYKYSENQHKTTLSQNHDDILA